MPFNLDQLQNRIGYKFRDVSLLERALTRPSGRRGINANYQRLEFLGDRVLGMIIAEALYKKYPQFDEGKMTKMFIRIVNNDSLIIYAKAIGLAENMRAGGLLSDTLEALIGAIHCDGGFEAACDFVLREFEAGLNDTAESEGMANPKGDLQEYLQQSSRPAPTYKELSSSGPAHDRGFICAAMCGDDELGRGSGRTKIEAEANAATEALEKLRAASPAPTTPTQTRPS
jgi:ribonuclease-3